MNEPIIWSPGITLEAIEKMVILKAYRHFRQNKTITSNALGISIRTLDSKLEKYEMEEKDQNQRDVLETQKRLDFLARSRGQGVIHDNLSNPNLNYKAPQPSVTPMVANATEPKKNPSKK